ncbi:UDP-glucuronosyltransferase 2B31-like [Perognathus longimembris pacificus]|uniref:UDP-glucuronosyltransferase 2B31-like n=1 Tax=Perognathus longimembris pacificus TaxID=214514 RepID=UPI002019118D|nr:UDP-glucuronosyltransferase 2B31-like [Perognathus longimembris pacificus]
MQKQKFQKRFIKKKRQVNGNSRTIFSIIDLLVDNEWVLASASHPCPRENIFRHSSQTQGRLALNKLPLNWPSLLLLMPVMFCFESASGGQVLVVPMEYSHWMNVKVILEELVHRGHEVTVLTSSAATGVEFGKPSPFKFEIFTRSLNTKELESLLKVHIEEWTYEFPKYSAWKFYSRLQSLFAEYSDIFEMLCKDMVLNKKLMQRLQASRFDVLLADPFFPCGELLAELLNIPFLHTLRFTPGSQYEKHCGGLPFPPSYVPVALSELTDRMTFMERVTNMMTGIFFDYYFQAFNEKKWNRFYSEVLGRPTTILELLAKADIWLIRTSWDLDFPRPLLPNFEFVGGLHCKPAKPLPEEMEKFVQSSGDHGVVVFSLGSMVGNLSEERANTIASALAQIPQKILWRYEGNTPDTLAPNTQLYKWIPQNDLLGHPKTKAFITHGGTNGVYEAIYHGVPMVGIPLFADQPDNIARVKAKGAAVRLDFTTFSSKDLLNALKAVIHNPSYKENAMRLSRIHHDQPVKPLDRAVFWIEFVMRHKGAKHLRPAVHDLTWLQYHSLDVIGFLLACVAAVIFIFTRCCLFCCRKLTKSGKKKRA